MVIRFPFLFLFLVGLGAVIPVFNWAGTTRDIPPASDLFQCLLATQALSVIYTKGHGLSVVRRVVRGGSWNNNPKNLRAANRNNNGVSNRNNNLGLRLVQAAPLPEFPYSGIWEACHGIVITADALTHPTHFRPTPRRRTQSPLSLHGKSQSENPAQRFAGRFSTPVRYT